MISKGENQQQHVCCDVTSNATRAGCGVPDVALLRLQARAMWPAWAGQTVALMTGAVREHEEPDLVLLRLQAWAM